MSKARRNPAGRVVAWPRACQTQPTRLYKSAEVGQESSHRKKDTYIGVTESALVRSNTEAYVKAQAWFGSVRVGFIAGTGGMRLLGLRLIC